MERSTKRKGKLVLDRPTTAPVMKSKGEKKYSVDKIMDDRFAAFFFAYYLIFYNNEILISLFVFLELRMAELSIF